METETGLEMLHVACISVRSSMSVEIRLIGQKIVFDLEVNEAIRSDGRSCVFN